MSELKKEYKKVIEDLEKTIQNKSELEYVKSQIYNLTNIFLEEMDKLQNNFEDRLEKLVQNMSKIETKLDTVEKGLNNIEKDIYIDDEEECDFEIVCPYCNHEFIVDYDELKDEVKCPECNNSIELDWNGETEEGCSGDCSCCGHEDCESNIDEDDM